MRHRRASQELGAIGALSLVAILAIGAWYEWGGPAARGLRQLKAGKANEAITSLGEAQRERPNSSAVRYDQGLAFQAAGNPDSARAAFGEARSLEGVEGRSAAAFNEGNAEYHAGRIAEAIEAYRAALRDDPKRADAKRNLEEALRLSRRSNRQQMTGNSGSSGQGSGGTGQRNGGGSEPPPGAANAPNQQRGGPPPSSRQSLGAPIPSPEEAEHWLDALEAERRAGRNREQAAKRAASRDTRGDRDW